MKLSRTYYEIMTKRMRGNACQDRFHEVSGCLFYKEDKKRHLHDRTRESSRLCQGGFRITGLRDEGDDKDDIRAQKVARPSEGCHRWPGSTRSSATRLENAQVSHLSC